MQEHYEASALRQSQELCLRTAQSSNGSAQTEWARCFLPRTSQFGRKITVKFLTQALEPNATARDGSFARVGLLGARSGRL